MPPPKRVLSLFDLCVKRFRMHLFKIWRLMINTLDDLEVHKRQKQQRRKELALHISNNLVSSVKNHLLNNVMFHILHSKFDGYVDIDVIGDALPDEYFIISMVPDLINDFLLILTSEDTSQLDLRHDLICEYSDSTSTIGNMCGSIFINIMDNVKSFASNLVSLNLEYASDDNVVCSVAMNCHNLQYLNIESFRDPDDKMIDSLRMLYGDYPVDLEQPLDRPKGCPKLQTLILPRCKKSSSGVFHAYKMILYMPDLCCIRNIDTRTVIQRYLKEGKRQPLKLIELEEWPLKIVERGLKSDIIETDFVETAKVVPHLKSYKSYTGMLLTQDFVELSKLVLSFTNLEQLVLGQDKFNLVDFDLSNFPSIPSLKVLVLDLYDENIFFEQIQALSMALPNLQELIIHSYGLYSFNDNANKNNQLLFEQLKSLDLRKVIEMDSEFLIEFLERCPQLISLSVLVRTVFSMGENVPITSEFIEEIKESLQNIEKLSLSREYIPNDKPLSLTKNDFLALTDACPKLKWLGKLGSWSVTEQEAQELIAICKRENWDLQISYSQADRVPQIFMI